MWMRACTILIELDQFMAFLWMRSYVCLQLLGALEKEFNQRKTLRSQFPNRKSFCGEKMFVISNSTAKPVKL
jgi:hypothetical protein